MGENLVLFGPSFRLQVRQFYLTTPKMCSMQMATTFEIGLPVKRLKII